VDRPVARRALGRQHATVSDGGRLIVDTQAIATMKRAVENPPASEGRSRILLVDDDERNLLALSEVLSDIAEVVTASSGQDALRQLLKGDFAVILLDVFMPGLDGYETAKLIREREQTSRIPIIFLSAVNKETEHLMRGYAMGAVDYVFKPVDPLVLKSKVSVFVDLDDMRRQIEAKSRAEQELREANFRAELERLEIERELQASRQRQAAIIQSLPIVLYLEAVDSDPRQPHFVSGNLEQMTGFSFDEVSADPTLWQDRLHPDDRERVLAALGARKASGHFSIEYRWRCADGRYKHFHDQAVILKDAANGTSEFAGTLTDVTEKRSLESQLIQAQKMDAIGQLTGGIAHDFNNLLAAVLGGLHVIERRIDMGEREKRVVGQMRHAAEQGAELVRRMMAFARKQDLSPASIDPAVLCQSVAGLVEHALGGRVVLEWNFPKTDLNLFVDRSQLELTLVNLILNARDAMPDGGKIEVSIEECESGDDGEKKLRICVKDEGRGIPADLIEKITEPFFTTKEAGKGTGLGLSMAAGFVQQSGGELRIESEPGKGSTIEVILPATAAGDGEATREQPAPEPQTLKGKKMLLIDDDESVRLVLCEQLRDLELLVDEHSSGASALEAVRAGSTDYDFVLSDFAMPGMNGLETIRELGGLLPGVRAVLMTGYADESLTRGAKTSVPIVHKPLDIEKICEALRA
jgi:signal transduction histidine kinase